MFKYFLLFFITIVLISAFIFRDNLKNLFSPVSVVSQVVDAEALNETDGRTNFLVLGVDSRSPGNNVTSRLTDTIMVISLDKSGDKVVMISIPRDLWVKEYENKVNSIYVLSGYDIEKVKSEIEKIVGIPIHYHAIVGFDIFTDSIDAVDGITVNVDETFDDYQYPIEGKENAMPESERYMHIHFDAGAQDMDGETALQYARSRHSTNPNEAGDFARSRRQQKVVESLKDKIVSTETLLNPIKLKDLYGAYKENVETNIELTDLLVIYQNFENVEFNNIEKIVLSNESYADYKGAGTLEVPTIEEREQFYNGLYILVPISRTYDQIHALIRDSLFNN